MKLVQDDQQIKIVGVAVLLILFGAQFEYLSQHRNEDSLSHKMIIEVLLIMLIMEPRMANKFWARSPISFKHIMPFWCPFLDPHITTHHSNKGVCLRRVTKLGPLTLDVKKSSQFAGFWIFNLN